MDKKIVELLNSNLRVIIPEFGALIITQQEPRIIVFNEMLKNNDGLLLDFIIKTENVEPEIAEQLLNDFTSQAFRVLDAGGSFAIEGIGSLKKDKAGKIVFSQKEDIFILEDTIIEKDAAKKTPGKKKSATISNKRPKTEKTTTPEIQVASTPSAPPIQAQEVVPVSNKNTESFNPYISSIHFNQVAKWAIIIAVANVAIFAFFVFKKDIRGVFSRENESIIISDPVTDQLADSVRAAVEDSTLILDDPMLAIPETIENSDQDLRYYIVAGCFRDEINADELVTSLKSKGYSAEKFGKIGDLYAVSFASFDKKEPAVKELARIRKEFHPDAWMTRF